MANHIDITDIFTSIKSIVLWSYVILSRIIASSKYLYVLQKSAFIKNNNNNAKPIEK